jgi:hypothetical protein
MIDQLVGMMRGGVTATGEGGRMVPKPVAGIVVVILTCIVAADVGAQYVIPGHTANLVLNGAIITAIGAILTGAKGPKPTPDEPEAPPPPDPPQPRGRHYKGE